MYSFFRRPKTMAERRASIAVDGDPAPRSKRNASNLPDAWDDQCHRVQRTWKKFGKRSRQWQ